MRALQPADRELPAAIWTHLPAFQIALDLMSLV